LWLLCHTPQESSERCSWTHATRETRHFLLTPSVSPRCGYPLTTQLYSEARREFLAMNRAALRLGNFDTMFLVSHSPEILDGADHVMTFTQGQVTLT